MTSEETSWPVPMKAIGAQNLLTMPGGVTKSGYLHKKGGTQFQLLKWPLRFVIIHKGCIYYFKSSTSPSPQGAFSLKGYNRIMRAAEETTSNNVFPFKLVHISKKHRTWFFSAASEDERKDWMFALRREIDHYHEKKETTTDLSDSGSDADSFYGSVERPININYSQTSTESSDYDQDDLDEEYLKPDVIDCEEHMVLPPTYPPPPVPQMGKVSLSETKVLAFSGKIGVAVLPPSPLKKNLPDLSSELLLRKKGELPFQYPAEKRNLRRQSLCPQVSSPGPPVPPVKMPGHFTGACSALPVRLPLARVLPTAEGCCTPKEVKLPAQTPPPLPSSKPKLVKCTVKPVNASALREHGKPGVSIPKVMSTSQVPTDKPPVPESKPEKPPLPLPSGSLAARRLPPDGQSFRVASVEKPTMPSRSNVTGCHEDSDEDYEKVDLPNSIFVNTSESFEVEKMFKSANPLGLPKNGLFCIRDSSTKTGKVLVVWDESIERVRNYRIFQQDSKFYLEPDILFLNITSLVEHYCSHVLPSHNDLMLRFPYGYSGPR